MTNFEAFMMFARVEGVMARNKTEEKINIL
jgi:hypothetical protein